MKPELTPVDCFGNWWAKRDDLAEQYDLNHPSGSKVRQYLRMALKQPNAPMLVGCSADSAMQIYVASAAHKTGVKGIVYTAARHDLSAATQYALWLGCDCRFLKPGYLSQCRAEAKKHGNALGNIVRWDVTGAVEDAAEQCANLPTQVKRVVVPTGSGLTCAGVMVGIARMFVGKINVLAVAVSSMAGIERIKATAVKATDLPLPPLELVRANGNYGKWVVGFLPDQTWLDPYYAAKALPFVSMGDCLWIPGVRPLIALPLDCQKAIIEGKRSWRLHRH